MCQCIEARDVHCALVLHVQAYALKRLARGLASGRGAARQGFALALTGSLAALPAVPIGPVLDLLDAALDAPNSMKVSVC